MLLAGAGGSGTPAMGGALAFDVNSAPSYAWWGIGSANNNPYTRNSIGIYFNIS